MTTQEKRVASFSAEMFFFIVRGYKGSSVFGLRLARLLCCCCALLFCSFTVLAASAAFALFFGGLLVVQVFFLYFTLFHVYFFSFPFGFSYLALVTTVLFLQHSMLFFWNRYEASSTQRRAELRAKRQALLRLGSAAPQSYLLACLS